MTTSASTIKPITGTKGTTKPVFETVYDQITDSVTAETNSKSILSVVQKAITTYNETETTVSLHAVVRGAIATEYDIDVSTFTMLTLLDHLVVAVQEKGGVNIYAILFPLTTEYTLATVGAEPWDYKKATMKIVYALLEQLK